jgi:hypothetical protein
MSRFSLAGLITVLLVVVGCVAVSAAQVTVGSGTTVTGPGTVQLKSPDLVIKSLTFDITGGGEFPTQEFKIVVKNIGAGGAGASMTAVYAAQDVAGANPISLFAALSTPALAAGAQTTLTFTRQMAPGKLFLVVVADAPVAGKPLGKVTEGLSSATTHKVASAELNNAFAAPCDPTLTTDPQVMNNPAVP